MAQANILVNLHEVAPYNPLFRFYSEHLKPMLSDSASQDVGNTLLGRLSKKVQKLSLIYSGLYVEYMGQNERQYKS